MIYALERPCGGAGHTLRMQSKGSTISIRTDAMSAVPFVLLLHMRQLGIQPPRAFSDVTGLPGYVSNDWKSIRLERIIRAAESVPAEPARFGEHLTSLGLCNRDSTGHYQLRQEGDSLLWDMHKADGTSRTMLRCLPSESVLGYSRFAEFLRAGELPPQVVREVYLGLQVLSERVPAVAPPR